MKLKSILLSASFIGMAISAIAPASCLVPGFDGADFW